MNHIDLFSGIGGFAYAAKKVWGEEYHNVLFCDNNKFCQEVIKKNFGKDSVIYGDIRDVTYANWNRLQEQGKKQQTGGDRQLSEITLLTGGFPCQPFSCAGKQKGTKDDRHLWPEMLRVIQLTKPTWIVAENVRGLLTIEGGLVFEQVCLDLESSGYEVQAFIIPAVSVNAPHRRDRVWIVANRKSTNEKWCEPIGDSARESERQIGNRNSDVTDTDNSRSGTSRIGTDGNRQKKNEGRQGFTQPGLSRQSDDVTNTSDIERGTKQEVESSRQTRIEAGEYRDFSSREWGKPWLEVATELCGVDDGIPAELYGFSKAGHRVERLKALGNAIVPQVAVEIFKAIKNT